MGPIKNQADSITRLLQSANTAVHLVSLLEEMPVQETIDAVSELRSARFGLGLCVVNLVRDPLLDEAAVELMHSATGLEASIKGDLERVGVRATGPMVRGLLTQGRDHADRVLLQDEMASELAETGLPLIPLPALVDGVEEGGIQVLAEILAEVLDTPIASAP